MQIEKLEVVCKVGGVERKSTIDLPVVKNWTEAKTEFGEEKALTYLNAGIRSALRGAEYSCLSPGSRKAEINREIAELISKLANGDNTVGPRVKELAQELEVLKKEEAK